MPTHGGARETTIRALSRRRAFRRSRFAMSAVAGTASDTGRMPAEWAAQYRADYGRILYTVLSYGTPIGWVATDGTVKVPDVSYSATTSHHQGLCRRYLA